MALKSKIRDMGWVLLVCGVISLVYLRVLTKGLPQTHDGQMQVARLAQYYLAINQGQIPPRVAPNANLGFGYPVFNFNYPLPYILGVLLIKAQIPIETAMKLLLLTAMMMGGAGMYYLLTNLISKPAAVLGGILYASSNYALLLVFVRGGIGEVWAYALMPWVLYNMRQFLEASKKNKNRWRWLAGITLGLFILAHNIMAMFGILVLGGYSLNLTKGKWSRDWWQPLLIGLGLSAFFWLPALAEQKYTIIKSATLSSFYQDHFPTLKQLIYDAWGYNFSRPGPVDGLSFNLNPIWLVILGFGGLLILVRKTPNWIKWLYGLMAMWFVVILPISKPLWQILPMVNYIQFPWRLLFFWPLIAVPIIVWVFDQTKHYWGIWVMVIIMLIAGMSQKNFGRETFTHPLEYWWHFTGTTSLLDENMPIWFNKEINYLLVNQVFANQPVAAIDKTAEINIEEWTGSRRQYTVNSEQPVRMVERIAYFPGLQVRIDNQPVPINFESREYPGLVTYELPAGSHKVISKMTQYTWPRLMGNGISMLTLAVIAASFGGIFYAAYKRK